MSKLLLISGTIVYTILLLFFSLAPSLVDSNFKWEVASGLEPKEGDNFKMANRPAVFKLINGLKHQYLTESSYHSYEENKSFDTPYEFGGILICDKAVVDAIPDGKFMPFRPGMKYIDRAITSDSVWGYVFKIDKFLHFIAYFFYSFLILLTLNFMYESIHKAQYIGAFVFCLFIGLGLEVAQYVTASHRDPELLDVLFNSIGVLVGSYVYASVKDRFLTVIEEIRSA